MKSYISKFICLLFVSMLLSGLSACTTDPAVSSDDAGSDSAITISTLLQTPGEDVEIPSSEGTLSGVTIDSNSDGSADGIDVNNDQQSDLLYVSGTLSAPGKSDDGRAESGFAFYFAGNSSVVYYFFLVDDAVVISEADQPPAEDAVKVVVFIENGIIIGVDTDGDLSSADVTLSQPLPVEDLSSFSVVSSSPAQPSGLELNADPIVITFSEMADTSTLVLGGVIGSHGSTTFAWSKGTYTNDTLTISTSATYWQDIICPSSAIDLSLSVDDLFGESITGHTLTYSVTCG